MTQVFSPETETVETITEQETALEETLSPKKKK